MSFNVAEYAKKKKKETGAADLAAPSSAERGSGSAGGSGFSVRDYALNKSLRNGGAMQKQEEYQAFRDKVASYGNGIAADAQKRNGKYQDRAQFGSYFDSRNQEAGDLLAEAYAYRDYWKQNGGAYDSLSESGSAGKDYLADVESLIEYLNGSRNDLFKEHQYWNQFEDRDSYNASRRFYDYATMPQAEDFGEKSKYVSTYVPGTEKLNAFSGTYSNTGFGDIAYDYINRNETAKGRVMLADIASNAAFLGLDNSERQEMTDDEIALFNYLYALDTAAGDSEHKRAYRYIDDLTSDLNLRQRIADESYWADYASQHPVGSSVFSIFESPLKGLSYLGQTADFLADGTIDQNEGYNKFSNINSAIRSRVSEEIENSGNWGKAGSFLYQTGMSMGDFLLNTAITGGNEALTLAIMGTGAAADTTISAKDRGLSDSQAFTIGTIAGAAEIITEKISLETLLDKTSLGKDAVGYLVKNVLAEGSEEVGSDVINLVADVIVAKDKSEWQTSIDAYMKDGMDENEAFWRAVGDQAATMGLDFLGGALSGGIMAGGAIAADVLSGHGISGAPDAPSNINVVPEEISAPNETQVPTAPVEAEPIAQQLMAAGADEASAQELAPILSEIISGQEISGNEAAKIAKSEAAVSVLEKTTGTQIDTNAPISAVKTAIKGLASPAESANDVRTGNLPVAAQNAPAAVSAPYGARDAKAAIAEFAGAFGSEGKTALTDNYDGNISPRDYAEAMTRFYNAGAASAKGQSINAEAMMRANTVLSQTQKLAAYRAGIRDTEAAAVKSQATAPAAQQSNEAIWNASNAQLMTASGRSPASYRYETVAVLADGTALHVFYDSKAKAEAATRNAVGLRGEGTQIVVDLRQPGALEKALKDVTYASGQQRAESEIRVAGSREAAEEARNTAAKLERQRVAAMNGEEVNTDGENGIVRQGRERNVPQRAGREAGPVSKETAAVREKWAVSGEPKDSERESLSYDEKINPHSLFTEATEGQTVFRDASKTKAVATGHALAEKNGYKAVAWGGGEIRVNDGGTIRGYALISKNEIGAQTDNPEFAYDDLTRHEIMEQKIGHGEIDADTVLDEAAKYVDKAKIDLVVTDVYLKSLGGDGLTGTELEEAIQQARNELVCDGADHINQLRYDVENGNLSGTYVALADLIDEVISGINRAANELTDGAFELEGEASGAEVSTAGGGVKYSRKVLPDGTEYIKLDKNTDKTDREVFNALVGTPLLTGDGDVILIVSRLPGRDMFKELMHRLPKWNSGMSLEELKRINHEVNRNIEDTISASRFVKNTDDTGNRHAENGIKSFDTRHVVVADNQNAYNFDISIAVLDDGRKIGYAKKYLGTNADMWEKIKEAENGRKTSPNNQLQGEEPKGTNSRVYRYDKGTDLSTMGASTDSVTDIPEKSNSKFSGDTDDGIEFPDYRTKFSRKVDSKETLAFLEKQDTITTYKTMQVYDGKLYPPMAARINGSYEDASLLGEWEQSTEHPELIKNGKFKLDKGKGNGSIEAAYNPYMHSSNLVLNDQFTGAYTRDNLVTVECVVPKSEISSGYHAEYAKDAVGWHPWHTGTVAGQLRKSKGIERQVFLSRWIKPVRIVPDAEVAAMYKELLDGTSIAVPDNVVTPSLLNELKKAGVNILKTGKVKYAEVDTDSAGASLSEGQRSYFADSKVRDAQGRLKVMYRGGNGDYTVFDRRKSKPSNLYGRGFYFTDSQSHAAQYGEAKPYYLNITNPLTPDQHVITKQQMRSFLEAVAADEDYGLENYGYGAAVDSVLQSIYGKGDFEMLQDVNATAVGDLVTAVELFNEVNGTDYDGIIVPTETVAFQSEQIKNTDNLNPTKDKDVRFSMKLNVEDHDEMIAWHNISSSAIDSAIELGGLAMPSWAVKRADSVHGDYGDISVIAHKDSIDPKRSKTQMIFSGDAWTPVFPSVDYKIDDAAAGAAYDKINGLLKQAGTSVSDFRIALDPDNVAETLARHGGSFVESYKDNDGMKLAFLKDTGRKIVTPMKEKVYSRYADIAALKEVIKQFPDFESFSSSAEMAAEPKLRSIVHAKAVRKYGQEIADKLWPADKELTFNQVDDIFYAARRFARDGAAKTVDTQKLGKRIDALMGSKKINAEYEAWLENVSKDIVAKKGIRNNAELYTSSGNRRSFDALHYEYNLANIVRVMQGQPKQGRTQFLSGSGSVKGAALKSFGSIEEVRAEIGRLVTELDESSKAAYDKFRDDTLKMANRISDDPFTGSDMLSDILSNAKTAPAIERYLNREYKFLETQDHLNLHTLAQQIYELGQEANTLPMEYFEAKTYRAFPFSEAAAVVVPNTMPKETRQKLIDLGANVITYKAGDNADRLKKVNSIDGARFSRKVTTFEDLRTENRELKDKLAEYQDTARELAKATKQATYWKGQTQLTKEPSVRQDDVDKLARQIIKGHYSTIKAADISERMKSLGDFIVRGHDGDEELTWAGAKDRAVSIARDVIENAEVLADNGTDDFYSEIKSMLKRKELLITRRDAEDIADFKYWRRNIPGYMHVKYTDYEFGGNIDQFYHDELQGRYPWLFEDVNGSGGKLEKIVDVMRSLEPVYENPYDPYMAEAIDYCANEIVNGLIDEAVRQVPPTFADRQAKKLADQKHIDAQRLARVREQKNAAIERIQARNRVRTQELLAKARADRDERMAALKQHYQDVAEARRERRLDSAARTRLLKIAKRLNNKKLPAVTREMVQQYIGELDLAAKSMTGATLEKLTDLQAWYAEQAETNPDFISDPSIEKALQRLSKKQIADLTPAEVADLTNVLLNIENEIRTQRKLIDSQVKHDTYVAGETAIMDIENSKGSNGGFFDTFLLSETLSPTRELHRITGYVDSDPLYVATLELADGQRKMFDYQRRANERFKQWLEDKKFTKTIAGKDAKEITITGIGKNGPTSVTITPAMRMSLYLHSLNDQNLRHIAGGGITVPDIKLYKKGDIVEAYNKGKTIKLTPSEVRRITDGMSEREKAFAKAAHDYYNGQSQGEINATSEKLKGYSVASVDNYFPIDTDRSFLKTEFDSIKRDGTIEGMGFLKERINAANPIMLYDLNSVLTKSITQHSKYVGLAIPVRNFSKIWGVTTGSFNDDGSRNNFESSVQKAVKEKWGQNGYDYIEQLMADLNNPAGGQKSWARSLAKARSAYAGAVLELNASVAIKQAASYPTAAATVGFRPLLKALGDTKKADLDLIAKYTPLLWYRSQGYSSQELGELAQRGKSLPKALNWIQAIDVATTTKLWKAAEYYVRANRKDLARGTDAYYKEVASVYNSIIEDTQPNYTAMQRPAILRSNNELVRTLNMFKTQPFQNFNILYDGIENLNAKRHAYTNDGSAENKKAYEEAKKKAAWAITSQLASSFVFALMQYAWDLFRSRDEKYRDKDGDYTVISWMKGMGFNMLTNGFGMFPFGTEVLEALEALTDKILKTLDEDPIFDATYYGVDVSVVETINNTVEDSINSIVQTVATVQAAASSDEKVNWESYARTMYDTIVDYAQLTGIPIDNVRKTAVAIAQQTLKATNGKYVGGYYALRLTSDPTKYSGDYYDLLYKAYSSDKEAYEEVYRLMIESGSFTEDKIKSGMEKRMKDAAGVTKVSELESRFLAPDQQDSYDKGVSALQRSDLWRGATDDAQDAALELLYGLVSGSNSTAPKSAREKIEGGKDVGIDQTEFLLYKLALSMADEPTESGTLGTYTNDEVEEAIRMLSGLTNQERAYLWDAQKLKKDRSNAKSNPWAEFRSVWPQSSTTEEKQTEAKPKNSAGDIETSADVSGSSMLSDAEYDPDTGQAFLTFRDSGNTYTYNVSPEEWQEFLDAPSKGSFVNSHWK